jgi:hypothetical protein
MVINAMIGIIPRFNTDVAKSCSLFISPFRLSTDTNPIENAKHTQAMKVIPSASKLAHPISNIAPILHTTDR